MIVAYFSEEFDSETRIARNSKTGENYEIPNMSYENLRLICMDY